jgi:tetratricopeptide (TPR) repeat protein
MGKSKRTVKTHAASAHTKRTQKPTEPVFIDLSDGTIPLKVDSPTVAEQLRRTMVGWSNYITRLSKGSMDRETTYLVARAILRRGIAHTVLFEWQAALNDLSQVISMHVGAAETNTAYYFRAMVHAELEQDEEALADWTRVLETIEQGSSRQRGSEAFTQGLVSDLYAYRARIYIRLERYAQAIADCDRALSLDPGCAEAYSVRGSAHSLLKQMDQALADASRAIELEVSPMQYYRRGLVYKRQADYEHAFADFDHAYQQEPENSHFRQERAELLRLRMIRSGIVYAPNLEAIPKALRGS